MCGSGQNQNAFLEFLSQLPDRVQNLPSFHHTGSLYSSMRANSAPDLGQFSLLLARAAWELEVLLSPGKSITASPRYMSLV